MMMDVSARVTRFRYRAVRTDGRLTKGVCQAQGIEDARAKLLASRLMPIALDPIDGGRETTRAIAAADVALVARVLSELIESGLPLPRALATLTDLAPRSWQTHLPAITEGVSGGASLSEALEATRGAVPGLMIGIVRAGEMGTGLAAALRSAADTFDAAATARNNLISALTYPAFLALACVGSLVLLVGVVLPRFAAMLSDLDQQLPPTTSLLLDASRVATTLAPAILAALTGLGVALWHALNTHDGRLRVHRALLRIPLLGDVRRAWASASVCGTASALLAAGVPLPVALQHASRACGDAAIDAGVTAARTSVLTGARPSEALAPTLTATCTRMVRAGEESGTLATMLDRAARLERARATRIVQRATKLLEPIVVLGFGAIVAFVAASLLQAVYAVRPTQ